MKDFFFAIQDLFVDVLFAPFDALRALDTENWWMSNMVSWILFLIGIVAFLYWMRELKGANDRGEEDKSITAHSYL